MEEKLERLTDCEEEAALFNVSLFLKTVCKKAEHKFKSVVESL